jgi:hypothetical protein
MTDRPKSRNPIRCPSQLPFERGGGYRVGNRVKRGITGIGDHVIDQMNLVAVIQAFKIINDARTIGQLNRRAGLIIEQDPRSEHGIAEN